MNMSKELKKDGLPRLQEHYARRSREGQSRMLDELCEDYEYERKYAIKLLGGGLPPGAGPGPPGPERRYEGIEEVVRQIWLRSEQPCGKRLVPILRQWLPCYERLCAPGMLTPKQRRPLRERYESLDPFDLKDELEKSQSRFYAPSLAAGLL